jgi:SMC interacting uncharacterized protein involved in chromosome segregation
MPTTAVYDAILAEITDDLERAVFDYFNQHAGETLTRAQLIKAIFGIDVAQQDLMNSGEDRKIRECIEALRKKDYPIVSTSGKPGFKLTTDDGEIMEYIGELQRRQAEIGKTIDAAWRSRRKAAQIQKWRETPVQAQQRRMF